jgi:hypothetical protein
MTDQSLERDDFAVDRTCSAYHVPSTATPTKPIIALTA